jgi:hypothetical protein
MSILPNLRLKIAAPIIIAFVFVYAFCMIAYIRRQAIEHPEFFVDFESFIEYVPSIIESALVLSGPIIIPIQVLRTRQLRLSFGECLWLSLVFICIVVPWTINCFERQINNEVRFVLGRSWVLSQLLVSLVSLVALFMRGMRTMHYIGCIICVLTGLFLLITIAQNPPQL